ncbi:MAG: SUMF1/EgtB/PvdO family nonheme iron enzyme [bacterium]|nr:SUMF1/EgtB/PvdO family nonheme iron enzyme [bacterium]
MKTEQRPNSGIYRRRRSTTVGLWLAGLTLIAAGGCNPQVRIPGDILQSRSAAGPGANGAEILADNMVLVHTPQHSFFIDPFEVSELSTRDYFAIRNQDPLVDLKPALAAEICAATGKRLCSRYEWVNACLGTHRRKYSYSDTYTAESCRTGVDRPALTGARSTCKTDTGIYDMVGNVMEWVAEERGGMAVAVGGSYLSGKGADCFTKFYFPNQHQHKQIGFRCCRSVSPGR